MQLGQIQPGGDGSEPERLRVGCAPVRSRQQMGLGKFVQAKMQVAGANHGVGGDHGEGLAVVGDVCLCPGQLLHERIPVGSNRGGLR
jgi:hypothetical protein